MHKRFSNPDFSNPLLKSSNTSIQTILPNLNQLVKILTKHPHPVSIHPVQGSSTVFTRGPCGFKVSHTFDTDSTELC